jgi:hypothetical protein
VVWQYLDREVSAASQATLEAAAVTATADAPLAHLSFEALDGDYANTQHRLTVWPGGDDRLLGLGGPHLPPVRWRA